MEEAMRIPIPALVLAALLPLSAWADSVDYPWRNQAQFADRMENAEFRTEVAGRPALPLQVLSLAIPEGMRVAEVRLLDPESSRIDLESALPRFEGLASSEGNLASLSSMDTGPFPADPILSWHTGSYRGIRSAEIVIAPWSWDRNEDGEWLTRLDAARFRIELEPDPLALHPRRQDRESWRKSLARVRGSVANPEDVDRFAPEPRLDRQEGLFQPRSMPSEEGSGVDMLIVTSSALDSIFQTFADFKTDLGVTTVVRSLDWILANYPQGADPQETLRSFIREAFEMWGIRFVLLAGDTQLIPARYALSQFIYPEELLPSDLYYAALDGDWNADGDEYFGESTYGGAEGDDVDLVADVFLGRIPVTNAENAQLIIDKIMAYTEAPDLDYLTRATFLGEVLFPTDWHVGDPDENITRNGADYCEPIIEQYLPSQFTARRLYETYWLYPGSEAELLDTVIDDLDTQAHIVHHVGHGFRYNMSVGEGNFMISDALAMNNGLDHLIQVYAMNCTSCAFDYNCLGEAFLLAENGGALTTIGSVREAFPQTAVYYQDGYYASLYADSCSIGESFTFSHNQYAPMGQIEGSHRWTQMSGVLFGDPSLEIWMDRPDTMSLALTEPFTLSSDTLKVYVSLEGSPVGNARVVAEKEGEDRAVGVTDAAGLLELPFHADSPGIAGVHVTANNELPLSAEIQVEAASGPRLSIAGLEVRDDPLLDGAIEGNADGVADAGETLRFHFWVENMGDLPAENLDLRLSAPGGELVLSEDSLSTGADVAAGDSLEIDLAFLASSGFELPERSRVILKFDFAYSGGQQDDRLDLEFSAPLPRLFSFSLDDSGGDGDGEMDAGEIATWTPDWKNYGSTPSTGWEASMTALDPGASVLSGPVTLPTLGLLDRGASAGIDLSENDLASPHRFELLLSGPLGQERRDTLTLRRPAAPDTLFLDSSFAPTVIDVTWEKADTNAAAYLIYRSSNPGGPYSLASTEPVSFTYFRNEGLEESTEYYFVGESVDSSGFRSARSPEYSVSTNPSMLNGWPAETGQGTASSLAIGDIDGDGDKEVVAGSNRIYAWHHDGSEVRDGDNNSGTYGVFSDVGNWFTASIALAQIDPSSPGLEIVGASRETQEIYVLDGQGTVLPGFPKSQSMWTWATPAVADVDNDGFMEIFVMCLDGNLYAWNHDGTPYLGNPDGIFASGLGSWTKSSPSLGQLDDDPELEVVIGTNWGMAYVWEHDGSVKSGWPISVGAAVNSSASLGDLDGDGDMEIVFLADSDRLYALNADGTSHAPRFPISLTCNPGGLAPSPVLVDFEDDGQMEIVAASVSSYHSMDMVIYNESGNLLPGWPVHIDDSSESSPVVVDLDGDRELEILLGTELGYLYAWEKDGSSVPGFPILAEAELRSSPTVDDLDDDLSVDVAIMGWDSWVYIWDMPFGYYNGLAQWKMFRANPARTGVFTREQQVTGLGGETELPAAGLLQRNYPNPFNPKTRISFITPAGSGRLPVKLAVYDIEGRLVKNLFEGELPRGRERSFDWDGRDQQDRALPSGVYFARIRMGETTLSRKMLLLK